jgi:flagellum-specific peptidoglycan hydrolase FlgJ
LSGQKNLSRKRNHNLFSILGNLTSDKNFRLLQ